MNRKEHILTVLGEEGVEVAKDVSKALRFGLDDKLTMNPDGPRGTEGKTNREKIADEFIDALGVYQMAVEEGILPDLGLDRLPPFVVEAMRAKAARVESFMRYARRVDALASLPKLSELACFHGIADMPFRVLVEGPQGYSHNAAAMTMEALIRGFTKSGRSVFPPALTDEAIAGVSDPMPVYAVHPDYNLADPPILTLFPKDRTADGYLVQWPDGTTDRAHAEHLIPLFPPKDWAECAGPDQCPECKEEELKRLGLPLPILVGAADAPLPDTDPAIAAGWASVPAGLKLASSEEKAARLRELGVGPFPTDPSKPVFPYVAGIAETADGGRIVVRAGVGHPNDPKKAPGLGVWQFRTDAWARPTWELFAMEEPKEDASDVPILARVQQRDRPALWSWEAWANPLTTGTESGMIPLGVPDGAEAGRSEAVEALIRSRSGKAGPPAPIGPPSPYAKAGGLPLDDFPPGKVVMADGFSAAGELARLVRADGLIPDPIADIPSAVERDGKPLVWRFIFRHDGAPGWELIDPSMEDPEAHGRRLAAVWQAGPNVWELETFEFLVMKGHEPTEQAARAGAERVFLTR